MRILGMSIIVLLAIPAYASDFKNLLTSPMIIAPAQYHQVDNAQLEGLVALQTKQEIDKANDGKSEYTNKSQMLDVIGVIHILDLHLGLRAKGYNINYEGKITNLDKIQQNVGTIGLEPTIAYTFADILTVAVSNQYQSVRANRRNDFNYQTYSLALHLAAIEAGASYSPKVKKSAKTEETAVFARFHLLPIIKLGMVLEREYTAALSESLIDQDTIGVNALLSLGFLNLEFFIKSKKHGYSEIKYAATNSIATNSYYVSGYFDIFDTASAGAMIDFEHGKKKTDAIDVTISSVTTGIFVAAAL